MRIYSFVGPEGAYVVLAASEPMARAILFDTIGSAVHGLQSTEVGMSLAVMFEPDMGYLVARPEEMSR